MGKNLLRLFNTIDEYNDNKCTHGEGVIAGIVNEPIGNKIRLGRDSYFTAVYDVTSIDSSTSFFCNNTGATFDISFINRMYIDDVEVPITNSYKFTTIGKHNIKCYVDTCKFTTCQNMFLDNTNLYEIDITHLNTSNCTSMRSMFNRCHNLKYVNLHNIDTSNVTSMYCMFQSCYLLTSLDVNNFNTSKVTSMGYMFNYLLNIKELNVSNFNVNNTTEVNSMFQGLWSIENIDIRNWNLSKVTSMEGMFNIYASNDNTPQLPAVCKLKNIYMNNVVPPTNNTTFEQIFDIPTTAYVYLKSSYKTQWQSIINSMINTTPAPTYVLSDSQIIWS